MKGLKTYLTFLHRNKLFTVVNVAGLSISLMFVLLIADMVTRQLSVDKNLKDTDRISVFASENTAAGHYLLGEKLQSRYPEIEEWCAYTGNFGIQTSINENPTQIRTLVARKNFFQFFGYKLAEGNPAQVLVDDHSIVLSRSCANRLFGNEAALGKVLELNTPDSKGSGNQKFTVTGIMEDIENSLIKESTEAIIPYENINELNPTISLTDGEMGNATSALVFFRTVKGSDLNTKAKDALSYLKDCWWIYNRGIFKKVQFVPYNQFYFHTETPSGSTEINQYSFRMVVLFLVTGIIILFMAIFNYVNMSIAQTTYRAKEMATRKLLGSSRSDIFWRMIGESSIMTVIAFILGFLLAKAAEPIAMDLLGVKLDLTGDLSFMTCLSYLLLIVLLSFISGFVPATILSNYNPLDVVKGHFRRKTKAVYLRVLNIVQDGLTIAMLSCAFYLSVQIHRILNEPLGYSYGNILCLTPAADQETLLTFRNEVQKLPFVKRISFAQGTPIDGGNNNTMVVTVKGAPKNMSFQTFKVDSAFIDMYQIQIYEDRKMPFDKNNWFISESASKDLGGATDYVNDERGRSFSIAGLFRDFHIRSVMSEQHPLRLQILPADKIYPWSILVEVQDGDLATYSKQITDLYSTLTENAPFSSSWYKDQIVNQYSDIISMNKLISIFTCAALIISLLGLTAMSIYFIAQRKRDIAIRKTFGSSSRNEMLQLMKFSFSSLLISLIIAIPLMAFVIHTIDKIVSYDSDFPWWVPPTAFAVITLISLGSVYLISRKAVRENPVNSIKTE